ncbi:MAG: DUF1565 domain-containing protein [Bacilli bacterium]|nr:DUF1565 domain-containing protein [Bacilli bacterium]
MKKLLYLLLILIIPFTASAYRGKNYRSFSSVKEMSEITVSEIDHSVSVFVSPDGDDSNSGTVDAPFKTITHAIVEAKCYNTIYLRSGTYNEKVTLDKSNLTLRNYPGEEAIITGVDLPGSIANIVVNPNLKNIKIYGLHIQDRQEQDIEAAYGIIVYGGVKELIIQNNEFKNINGNTAHYSDLNGYNAGGIVLYGDQENPIQDVLIANNKLHDMDCGKSEAITTTGYVNKVDIIENDIRNIFNIGIDIAGHYSANSNPDKDYSRYVYVAGNVVISATSTIADNSGIYVDGAKGVLVERNYVEDCPFGVSIDQENDVTNINHHTEDIVVSSNLFYHNIKGGIRVGTTSLLSSSVFNSVIINNTVMQKTTAGTGALVIAKSHDNEIVNNVIFDEGSWNNLIFTDDYSTSNEIYNYSIANNYLWSNNHLWFVNDEYFFLANTHYTEVTFAALPFVTNNIIGTAVSLNTDYSIVAGSILDGAGLSHEYKSILRDYNGNLGTSSISLGYINVQTKTDTEEDINALSDIFPFKKNYIIEHDPNIRYCSCVEPEKPTTNEIEVNGEVKGAEEETNNPKTSDSLYIYVLIIIISLSANVYLNKKITIK